ncbi:hypothetical protein ZHAS_00006072 [Anopheles sinensis]|uniref:Uncharacterized protein n=1 Tax=Anopheles sinensis TaxID=74873 RepID=A0A084VL33_ANOSI|nr:hypothetical protein ZHAS_00006072 [Anopheles sinensis]
MVSYHNAAQQAYTFVRAPALSPGRISRLSLISSPCRESSRSEACPRKWGPSYRPALEHLHMLLAYLCVAFGLLRHDVVEEAAESIGNTLYSAISHHTGHQKQTLPNSVVCLSLGYFIKG